MGALKAVQKAHKASSNLSDHEARFSITVLSKIRFKPRFETSTFPLDVIVNGDLEEEPAPTGETSAPPVPKTAKQLVAKRNQERVKSILLLAIPDEYLLKFHNVADAKSLWEAIKSRFGGNEESKKMQKNSPRSLRSFMESKLPLIMRNKPDIDEIDIDDLYNNLRVYEDEMKSTASGDFEVSTAGGISQVLSTPCAHDVACSFFAQPTTSPQLENENFQQIDEDDLEELDLKWQVAMLTVKVRKFIQKTGKNMDFKEKQPFSLDKSIIECYNYHGKGHFAREKKIWMESQGGNKIFGDNGRRHAPTNESSSQALVAQDGLGGYDWSNDFEIEPVNYALMAISSSSSSSSSDNEDKLFKEEGRGTIASQKRAAQNTSHYTNLSNGRSSRISDAFSKRWIFTGAYDDENVVRGNQVIFSICIIMGFYYYQWDVKEVPLFLYGTIKEEVYVHQPPGFVDLASSYKVYKYVIGASDVSCCIRNRHMCAVCACARFQVTPKASHLNAVKRIFRYLKHQPKLGLWYPRDSPFELEAFSDSDYGGASLDRKSTTGGCQFLGRRLISWQCKKQTIMANSTTEAEYVAAAHCCGQVLWIQNQMMDYGFNFMNTKIHIDNESTISVIKNHVAHSRTKHIEIRFHFIRDCYEKRLIEVIKIHTNSNVADLLTKGFDVTRFNFLVVFIYFVSIGCLNL
ncbi:hypothetical protein Tco_0657262 [Tanacetum coccineum]|uniref:Uncharacterized protein n=1 Tax=Tanacetum coccineum TaxID=301880 RepID=A0ABQ4XBW1_9ASTR